MPEILVDEALEEDFTLLDKKIIIRDLFSEYLDSFLDSSQQRLKENCFYIKERIDELVEKKVFKSINESLELKFLYGLLSFNIHKGSTYQDLSSDVVH